ncbi:hypothetical protein K3495_g794 [Podosphaera aphanis]|nr:hypothetical protein K3495_g794 [Podosphaera aphanis]
MRSIILVQIVSSLLIGAASATPTNAYSTGELKLRSSDFTEACSDHDFHLDDKHCAGDDCAGDKLRLAKRCHPCEQKKGSKTTVCVTHETTSHAGKKCESGKSCEIQKNECHGKEKCDEKKRKNECHGKEKCDEKKMKTECHGKDKCDHVSKETLRGYRCSGQLYNKSNVHDAAKKGCKLVKNNKKKHGYPMLYLPSAGEIESNALDRFHSTGKYHVYPLSHEKNYKFGPRESSMVLFDDECTVFGAVVRKTTSPCPAGIWCFAQLYKKSDVHYTSCDQDYRQ